MLLCIRDLSATPLRMTSPGILDTTSMFSQERCASWQKNGTGAKENTREELLGGLASS